MSQPAGGTHSLEGVGFGLNDVKDVDCDDVGEGAIVDVVGGAMRKHAPA